MTSSALLNSLLLRGVSVRVLDGVQLEVAPRHRLTPEIVRILRRERDGLLAHLARFRVHDTVDFWAKGRPYRGPEIVRLDAPPSRPKEPQPVAVVL